MPISNEVARCRGRVGGLKRAVRNGERATDDPALENALRALDVEKLAEHAAKVVAAWPTLTKSQRDRIGSIMASRNCPPARAGYETAQVADGAA